VIFFDLLNEIKFFMEKKGRNVEVMTEQYTVSGGCHWQFE
jgi:hypothetical protein